MKRFRFNKKQKGFTLIEVLIAMVLSAILLTSLFVLFEITLKSDRNNRLNTDFVQKNIQLNSFMGNAVRVAGSIAFDNNTLVFYGDSITQKLELLEKEAVLHMPTQTDTLRFERIRCTVSRTPTLNLIKTIRLATYSKTDSLVWLYSKKYDHQFLYQQTNTTFTNTPLRINR